MARVFVSYDRLDRDLVLALTAELESARHQVFVDERSIAGGRNINESVRQALRRSHVTLALWTKNSQQEDWVHHEAAIAAYQRKLVSVTCDSEGLPPKPLRGERWVEYRPGESGEISHAIVDVRRRQRRRLRSLCLSIAVLSFLLSGTVAWAAGLQSPLRARDAAPDLTRLDFEVYRDPSFECWGVEQSPCHKVVVELTSESSSAADRLRTALVEQFTKQLGKHQEPEGDPGQLTYKSSEGSVIKLSPPAAKESTLRLEVFLPLENVSSVK